MSHYDAETAQEAYNEYQANQEQPMKQSRFSKLKNKAAAFKVKHAPRTNQAIEFIKENYMDIAIGLACVLIVEDIDDIAECAEISTAVDVMTAANEGVI
tara:strand:+ start:698 stop:994 length:297 start_codon:yes stop_codon:yes gene_type:complete